jgi:RimJ/RimL family protein N-acetyltransferase
MGVGKILETERLILRTFEDTDLGPMTEINQDPKVMAYFPSLGDLQQTWQHMQRIQDHFAKYGYSLYAVELKNTGEFIGFVGLLHRTMQEFSASFMPATEIGWRISAKHWGHGYAPEAAKALLHYAFTRLGLTEIVSFTTVDNHNSRRVMEKIQMAYNPAEDFDHPHIEKTSALCRHVLYRLPKKRFYANNT